MQTTCFNYHANGFFALGITFLSHFGWRISTGRSRAGACSSTAPGKKQLCRLSVCNAVQQQYTNVNMPDAYNTSSSATGLGGAERTSAKKVHRPPVERGSVCKLPEHLDKQCSSGASSEELRINLTYTRVQKLR